MKREGLIKIRLPVSTFEGLRHNTELAKQLGCKGLQAVSEAQPSPPQSQHIGGYASLKDAPEQGPGRWRARAAVGVSTSR